MLPQEQTLVARARQGDHRAFDQLVEQYRPRLLHLCCDILGNTADAEDAVQTAWVQAYRALEGFRGEAGFYTWLWSIARNVCNNTLRARLSALRTKTMSLDDSQNCHLAERPDAGPAVEEQVLGAPEPLLERVLAKAEGKWDKRDYDLFLLLYGEGKTYEEIAQLLHTPTGTLRSRKHDHIEPVLEVVRQECGKERTLQGNAAWRKGRL